MTCHCKLPDFVHFGREVCGRLDLAERREWLVTNGAGSYACGTVAGTLTRRYHGLLIAPLHGALTRYLVFAKADAELLVGDRVIPLHTNRWGSGAIVPSGYSSMVSFRLDGRMPVWRFASDDMLIESRVWMEPGAQTTYHAFRLLTRPPHREARLRVRLLVGAREHHGTGQPEAFVPAIVADENNLQVTQEDAYRLLFRSRCGITEKAGYWVEDFDLPEERERGLPDRDRFFCAGTMTFSLDMQDWVGYAASLEDDPSPYLCEAMRRFQERDLAMLTQFKAMPGMADLPAWVDQLLLATDSFLISEKVVRGGTRAAIVAGYPWFGEWGRDTMIALPGLLLTTGRSQLALQILDGYLPLVDRGMLPNNFPGDGEQPQYNTVDAALWFIEAWRAYIEYTRDTSALGAAWPVLRDIIRHYRDGTRYGIAMDPSDGLLRAGEAGVQLTWMDAKVGDTVITPRIGKPVEVNALWYNALESMDWLAQLLKEHEAGAEYAALAQQARAGFQRFRNPGNGGLYDVLDGPKGNDARIRPNQIFAVSLHYSPLGKDAQRGVVELVASRLLTFYGLRSLDPADPGYRPRYQGDVWARDSAYHQGTVWAWLLGHYALAEYRVTGDAGHALLRLEMLRENLADDGLGTLSEIFDAEPPHTPRGCPAQAWSVACVLEAWWKLHLAKTAHQKGKP